MRIIIRPFEDPAVADLDWPEQYPGIRDEWSSYLDAWPEAELEFELRETYQSLGADLPAVTIEVLKLAGLVVSIPAVHKLIRETIAEWREIWKNLQRLRRWVERRSAISSYSIEAAFIAALAHLDATAPVDELELVSRQEIPGATDSLAPGFETAPLLYYIFIFRHSNSTLHVVVLDSRLKVANQAALPMHPMQLDA